MVKSYEQEASVLPLNGDVWNKSTVWVFSWTIVLPSDTLSEKHISKKVLQQTSSLYDKILLQ